MAQAGPFNGPLALINALFSERESAVVRVRQFVDCKRTS
jgi:hypothetical protein